MNSKKILICLILIAIGYFITMMFSRSCKNKIVNRFNVGGKSNSGCPNISSNQTDLEQMNTCYGNKKCKWI